MLPVIDGEIERRLLVNYRVDPQVIARVLPDPFRPQLVGGAAVAGICLIRLGQMRPRHTPRWVGLRSENAAHRVAVEWDTADGPQAGVYIPRRDSDSWANVLLGGRIFKHSAVACGATAVEAAQNVSADLCLLGVTGVHPEAGLTTGDAEEAAMKRALAARAADTYILASSEKIGTASRFRVLPWEEISGLITDADPHDAVVEQLRAVGVEILMAG